MKVLVTGGAGFIGSHIANRLIAEGFDVVVFDNFSSGKLENLHDIRDSERLKVIVGDICNVDELKAALVGVQAVFHEAASISVQDSIKDPIAINEVNVKGTLNLLKAACNTSVEKLIFASSAAVYGGGDAQPEKREDMLTEPSNPYGVSKLAAESYVKAFWKLYGLKTVALRYFNVYGPRQRFDINSAYGGVIPIFLNRIAKSLPPIIFGDGEQTRDFISVHDIVEANMLALKSDMAVGKAVNIGSGNEITINQVAEILKKSMGQTQLSNMLNPAKTGDDRNVYANIGRAKKLLRFTPEYSFERGISKLIQWYTQNSGIL